MTTSNRTFRIPTSSRTRWTKPLVKRLAEACTSDHGITIRVCEVVWLGPWCAPRRNPTDTKFRCARLIVECPDGRRTTKRFVAERDGSWRIS